MTPDQIRAHLALHGWLAVYETLDDRHNLVHPDRGTVWSPAWIDEDSMSDDWADHDAEYQFGLHMDGARDVCVELAAVPDRRLLAMWAKIQGEGHDT